MGQNRFNLIEQTSDMLKIQFSFIIYACCLNKTTKTINKLTNEQPSSHFLVARTQLYKPLCRSVRRPVGPLVRRSVGPSHFTFFSAKWLIELRVRDLWRSALFFLMVGCFFLDLYFILLVPSSIFRFFLDATRHLYKRSCPSVHRSVRRSVRRSCVVF